MAAAVGPAAVVAAVVTAAADWLLPLRLQLVLRLLRLSVSVVNWRSVCLGRDWVGGFAGRLLPLTDRAFWRQRGGGASTRAALQQMLNNRCVQQLSQPVSQSVLQ